MAFCTVLYIVLGILGAASYRIDNTSNILATISSYQQGEALRILSLIINVLFPLSVLVTSIPIFSIVIRYNLLRGKVCSRRTIFRCFIDLRMGAFLGGLFPMDSSDSFSNNGTAFNDFSDDKGWLNTIVNWGSLLFGSLANFVIPFFLYFVSKRYRALALPSASEGNYFLTLLICRSERRRRSTASIPTLFLPQRKFGTTNPLRNPWAVTCRCSSSHVHYNH